MIEEEIYKACRDEAGILYGMHGYQVRHNQMRTLWYMYSHDRTQPPQWSVEFLHWLQRNVNNRAFHAEKAIDPNPQAKLEF